MMNGAKVMRMIDVKIKEIYYKCNCSTKQLKKGADEDDKRKNYKIWRYVTENTIPTIDKQEEGISTGIMFKGKMIPSDDIDKAGSLYDALTNVKDETILYVYEKRIYVSWKEVRAAAIQVHCTELRLEIMIM